MTSWLVASSQAAGLVLVVDDLHWAAKPTLLMLQHLLQNAPADAAARLLVVSTYRDTDVDRSHPLSSVLADLRRLPHVDRVALGGLDLDEVVAMVESVAGHEIDETARRLAAAVYAETEGNPFFVGEVLRHLVETGQVRLVDGRWQVIDPGRVAVPEGVRDVVGRRLGRLSESANAVLSTASVIGRDLDLDVLVALVDGGEDAVLDALDEASRANLVEETAPDRFRFTHAVVRSTLYDELSSTRRRRLHRRIGEVIEKLHPDDVVALAHHSVEAGPEGGHMTRAIAYLRAAADQALQARALSDAEAHYRQVLELLDDAADADPAIRVETLCGLGEAQRDQGDPTFRETLLTAGRAALAQGRDGLAARAAIANFRGFSSIVGGIDRDRVEVLEAVHERIGDQRTAANALVAATLGIELLYDPDTPAQRRLALIDQALDLARGLGDARVLAEVHTRTLTAWQVPERVFAAPAHADEGIALADATGDPTLRAMSRAGALAPHLAVGDLAAGRRIIGEAVDIATADCPPFMVWAARANGLQFTAYDGDLDTAQAENDALREFGEAIGEPDALNWWGGLASCLAFLQGAEGDWADLAGGFADQYLNLPTWRTTHLDYLAAAGRVDEARAAMREHGMGPERLPPDWFTFAGWVNLGRAAWRLDDSGLGAAVEAVLRPYTGAWATVSLFVLGPVTWGIALGLAAQHRYTEAAGVLDEIDGALADRGLEFHRVVLRDHLARVLLASGDEDDRRRGRAIAAEAAAAAARHGLDRRAADLRLIAAQ